MPIRIRAGRLECPQADVYTTGFKVRSGIEVRYTRHEELDPMAPQREAAMFYGLFLRGYSVEELREEIDIPKSLIQKFLKNGKYEGSLRESMRRSYQYRKQVLAIFDDLVSSEKTRVNVRLQ